ncbi:MAG TPA: hypothetical protein VKZ58_02755 [Longimicrobiales bacterium]|nr:hypothetical protein [Longimicrobiales bacterium]
MALAVTQERLLEVHTQHALELVERARGEVPVLRALRIYCRLHDLYGAEAGVLMNRVIARLGLRPGRRPGPAPADSREDVDDWTEPSWFQRLMRRLRGRVNHELRTWIEIHTARTEVELIRVYVEGALRAIRIVQPTRSYTSVLEYYITAMRIRPSLARAVFIFTLARLGSAAPASRIDERPTPTPPQAAKPAEQILRVVAP